MSAYDYSRVLASAQRLATRYGRVVALQGVSAGPADANNPLAGPAPAPDPVTDIPAVFVPPSSLQSLGMDATLAALFASSDEIALIAPVSGKPDLIDMQFLIETDGKIKKITRISTLKPANVILLYYIGVKTP